MKLTPDDLDKMREIFGVLAGNDDPDLARFGKRAMRAMHACRKKHGFTWSH